MDIFERYQTVRQEVAHACEAAGRAPSDVRLVAVSKTVGPEGAEEAFRAGARDFGENRPEQLTEKAAVLPQATWHFIGNIQSRQIRHIVEAADLVHSLFQLRHAQKMSAVAQELGMVQKVLMEVNVSGEESKSGLAPDEAALLLEEFAALPGLQVCGLMTMAPQGDLAVAAECFADLRMLADSLRHRLPDDQAAAFRELSMGMSEDWRVAIEEGATLVRIGRAIFSDAFE